MVNLESVFASSSQKSLERTVCIVRVIEESSERAAAHPKPHWNVTEEVVTIG